MDNCLFCKIVKGILPAQVVFDDQNLIAFKDIHPQAPVHILIIPKQHVENLSNVPEHMNSIVSQIPRVASLLAKEFGIDKSGFRLLSNSGTDGGQTVFHLHFHLMGGKPLGPKLVKD